MTRLTSPYNEWEFVTTTDSWHKGDDLTFRFPPFPGVNANITYDGMQQITIVLRTELEPAAFDDATAAEMATQVIDRLAFETCAPLTTPRLRSKIDKNGRFSAGFQTMRQVTCAPPSEEVVEKISESRYKRVSLEDAAAFRLFRESLIAQDQIAGFLLMWNLLVMLERNEQNADQAIKTCCPTVPMVKPRKGKCRTSVRDARDEVAHMVQRPAYRARPDVGALRSSVGKAMPYLMETVRWRLKQREL